MFYTSYEYFETLKRNFPFPNIRYKTFVRYLENSTFIPFHAEYEDIVFNVDNKSIEIIEFLKKVHEKRKGYIQRQEESFNDYVGGSDY